MHGQSEGRIHDGEDSPIILELLTTHIDNRFAELSKRFSTFRLKTQAEVQSMREYLSE